MNILNTSILLVFLCFATSGVFGTFDPNLTNCLITSFDYCHPTAPTPLNISLQLLGESGYPIAGQYLDSLIYNSTLDCYTENATSPYTIDSWVKKAILHLQYVPYIVPEDAASTYEGKNKARDCAEFAAMYLCSVMFRYPSSQTLQICDTFCDPYQNKFCNQAPLPTLFEGKQILVNNQTCYKDTTSNPDCSVFTMRANIGEWDYQPIYPVAQKESVLKGTLLGFGLLIAFLLIIGTLGIIMRSQQKK